MNTILLLLLLPLGVTFVAIGLIHSAWNIGVTDTINKFRISVPISLVALVAAGAGGMAAVVLGIGRMVEYWQSEARR